jgi:hypothetical protein
LAKANPDANLELSRLSLKLATGAGKRPLMFGEISADRESDL